MSHSVVQGRLASAVAAAATFTVSYPTGKDKGNFFLAMGHKLVMGQVPLFYPVDFDVTLNTAASGITITNKTSATWPAETDWKLQLEELGERSQWSRPMQDPNMIGQTVSGVQQNVNTRSSIIASTVDADLAVMSLGAPIALDADGVCAAQAIAGAANASINGALASGGAVTLDVPRALQMVSSGAGDNTQTVTVTGTDVYRYAMKETFSLNGTTAVTGKKAFKTITQVAVSAAMAGNLSVGTTDILGLPEFLPERGFLISELHNGMPAGGAGIYQVPFFISQVDLLAPVPQELVSPVAGNIVRAVAVCQLTIVTGGNIAIKVGGTDVTGLTLVFAGGATPGTVVSDTPTTVGDSTTAVVVGSRITVAPDASFATSGAVNGFVEIQGVIGTLVAGIRTAGGSTATTGDVRGTYKPSIACDGTTVFQLICAIPDRNLGIKQYAG